MSICSTHRLSQNNKKCPRIRPTIEDCAKDEGPGEIWPSCSFHHDPLQLQILYLVKLQLRYIYAIYRLRFYSNPLIHVLSLSKSHHNVASLQKNRGDKSHRIIVASDVQLICVGHRSNNKGSSTQCLNSL